MAMSPSNTKEKTEKAISEAKDEFLKSRWEAIVKGKNTDCVILVHDNKTQPQKFHGMKWLMITASETFDRMFNGAFAPVDDVVQIKDVKPKIFKCLLQYIHLAEIFDKIDCQEAVELAQAADMYLMEPLKKHCIALIESSMTVEKVWSLLSQLLQVNLPDLAAVCIQFLTKETLKCIKHRTFLSASEESVIAMLKQDKLNVVSEMQLIKHCKLWAKANSNDTKKVMQRLMPHVRLLTLSSAEVAAELAEFMTPEMELALGIHLTSDGPSNAKRLKVDSLSTLCPLSTARIRQYKELVLDLFCCKGPAFSDDIQSMSPNLKCCTELLYITNTIKITAKVDMHLTSLEGFCRIEDIVPGVQFDKEIGGYDDVPKNLNYYGRLTTNMRPYLHNIVTVTLDDELYDGCLKFNGTWSGRLKKPYTILKGESKEIEVSIKANEFEDFIYRKVNVGNANAYIKRLLRSKEAGQHMEKVRICSDKNPIFVKSFGYVVRN